MLSVSHLRHMMAVNSRVRHLKGRILRVIIRGKRRGQCHLRLGVGEYFELSSLTIFIFEQVNGVNSDFFIWDKKTLSLSSSEVREGVILCVYAIWDQELESILSKGSKLRVHCHLSKRREYSQRLSSLEASKGTKFWLCQVRIVNSESVIIGGKRKGYAVTMPSETTTRTVHWISIFDN